MKHSYHIVVDNGMAFANNKDVKQFINAVFHDNAQDP